MEKVSWRTWSSDLGNLVYPYPAMDLSFQWVGLSPPPMRTSPEDLGLTPPQIKCRLLIKNNLCV